jgi:uncharacterized cupin superfamily protein
MQRVSLSRPTFTHDPEDPKAFRAGLWRVGPSLGARQSGASLYELEPGIALCPYHYEYGEEEWLLVIDGHPSVRTPDGVERLDPEDLVFFPTGPQGAHQVRNDSDATARVLMWSTVVTPTATAYPDSGKIGVWTGVPGDDVMVRRSSRVDYYDGEAG